MGSEDGIRALGESVTTFLSAVGGIGGTVAPRRAGEGGRAWILTLLSRISLAGSPSSLGHIGPAATRSGNLESCQQNPSRSDGWSYCFSSLLFKTRVA